MHPYSDVITMLSIDDNCAFYTISFNSIDY